MKYIIYYMALAKGCVIELPCKVPTVSGAYAVTYTERHAQQRVEELRQLGIAVSYKAIME